MTSTIERYIERDGWTTEAPDDIEAATEYCAERNWGDGLPVIPPTVERVERMLRYWDRPWHERISAFPPRNGDLTAIRVAANAVMAGCRPEYFPLLMLMLETMTVGEFNLKGLQATTHPGAPLAIVNGPIGRELRINSGHNAFGPGNVANATIGRAVRLVMLNIGGAHPGIGDMSTMGSPAKYSFVVAENEQASPWEPLHVERGFDRDVTTVTMVAAEGPLNINDHYSTTGEGVLTMAAGTIANTGPNNLYYSGEPVVAFSPEHVANIGRDGYSKQDVKNFIFQKAWVPLGRFSADNIEGRYRAKSPDRYAYADDDTRIDLVRRPEDLIVIVLGGAGKHSMYLPSFGPTRAVTRALKLANGEFARSVEDFVKH